MLHPVIKSEARRNTVSRHDIWWWSSSESYIYRSSCSGATSYILNRCYSVTERGVVLLIKTWYVTDAQAWEPVTWRWSHIRKLLHNTAQVSLRRVWAGYMWCFALANASAFSFSFCEWLWNTSLWWRIDGPSLQSIAACCSSLGISSDSFLTVFWSYSSCSSLNL